MTGLYSTDQDYPSGSVLFSVSHPLFSRDICALSRERSPDHGPIYRDYQEWLRSLPLGEVSEAVYRLRDRDIVTSLAAFDQARVLIGLSKLNSDTIRKWHNSDLDYPDYDTAEDMKRAEQEERDANNPIKQAKASLVAFLAEHDVHYTNDELTALFDDLCVKLGWGFQPMAAMA